VTIGGWFVLFLVGSVHDLVHLAAFEEKLHPGLVAAVDGIHFVLPKPGDLAKLNEVMLLRATGTEETLRQQDEIIAKMASWEVTISTSAAFVAVMLGLACWQFSRKDY
jgi:hypothetical protein